jgi:23S rRNA (cytidine1920-2'-O)/16S rRNA (cytidine1409-2'-O)-methyltransferase
MFVSRAGLKLDHALEHFALDVTDWICADLGCNAGGFVDCLLQRAAAKVYAVDTGYGALEYKLRKDPRVVVMERTNAMHVTLAEPVDLVTIDVAWTRQKHILPAAARLLKPKGRIISLIKPHYEADRELLHKGVLPAEALGGVLEQVRGDIEAAGCVIREMTESPIRGGEGGKGNAEFLALIDPPVVQA